MTDRKERREILHPSDDDLMRRLNESLREGEGASYLQTPSGGYTRREEVQMLGAADHYERLGIRMGLSGVELAQFVATNERQDRVANESTMANLEASRGTSARVPVAVYPSPKIKSFKGKESVRAGYDVEEFVMEMRAMLAQRDLGSKEGLQVVLSYVEGDARREVKNGGRRCFGAEDVFEVLNEAYGDNRSLSTLLKEFSEREQLPRETVREFATDLHEKFERLVKKQETSGREVSREELLCDHFIEGVRDKGLVLDLKRQSQQQSQSFRTLRRLAIDWEETIESGLPKNRATSRTVKANSVEVESRDDWKEDLDRLITGVKEGLKVASEEKCVTGQIGAQCSVSGGTTETGIEDVRQQMHKMTRDLEELKGWLRRTNVSRNDAAVDEGGGQSRLSSTFRQTFRRGPRSTRFQYTPDGKPVRFQYTPDGKPVCAKCNCAGHVWRRCPGVATQGEGPLNDQPSA